MVPFGVVKHEECQSLDIVSAYHHLDICDEDLPVLEDHTGSHTYPRESIPSWMVEQLIKVLTKEEVGKLLYHVGKHPDIKTLAQVSITPSFSFRLRVQQNQS